MAKYKKPQSKKVNQETGFQQFVDFFLEMMTAIFVFIMLTIYPLFYHNKYFDMGDSKFAFFETVSIVFMASLLIGSVMWLFANLKHKSFIEVIKKNSVTDWFALGYLAVSYISFILSEDKKMAFFGFGGWNMGFLSQLLFVLIYFYVSKCWKWSPSTLIAGLIAAFITYFLAVVMRFGFDPLGMYENLNPVDIEKFVSTLGQTTWYSSYAVLLLPLGIFYYMNDEKKWIKIFSGIFIFLGGMSLCTTNCDSAYIAYGFIMLAFFWFALESNDKFIKFLDVASFILISCRVVGLLQDLFPERQVQLITGEEKISKFITHSSLMLILLIVFVVLDIVLRYMTISDEKKRKDKPTIDISKFKIVRVIAVALVVIGLIAVVILINLTTNHKLPAFLEKLYGVDFFIFNDLWGNARGFNWTAAITAFKNAGVKDLFVGVGPDCFDVAMTKYCAEEVRVFWKGLHLACAHNEFLNLLVTEGLLGIFTYLGIMVSSFIRCAKVGVKEPAAVMIMAVIVSYIGHNFFCYQQCLCTPFLFIFMGMGELIIRETKKSEK